MDESNLHSRLRKAIGEAELPPHLRVQIRKAVRQAERGNPLNYEWIPGAVAVLLTVAIVAGFVAVSPLRRGQSPITSLSPVACAASSLSVTGTNGERLHPAVLPSGFVLTFGREDDLGAMNELNYSAPGYGEKPYIEVTRYMTTRPVETLLSGSEPRSITVQGKPAVRATGLTGSPLLNIAWMASDGVAVIVTGYKLSDSDVLAFANNIQYTPGRTFNYPAGTKAQVTRTQALAALPGQASSKTAILTSFGELDAVLHSGGPVNHQPSLRSGVEVIRPVWVVWGGSGSAPSSGPQSGVVIDANSSARLAELGGVNGEALSSLTDRSQGSCEPPLGVLTRSEFIYLSPKIAGVVSTVKLMTLGTLRNTKNGSSLGNCMLLTCDPTIPVWAWSATASDWQFLLRVCPPPNAANLPCPTPPPGSWQVRAFDARTGPQHSELSGTMGGFGLLPLDVAALPDLAPTT
jgi:hypothetical protein